MQARNPEFLVLGPLEARGVGEPVDLGPPKQRVLLGVLLRQAPHPVPLERLVDAIWPDRPPGDPVRSIQVYVSALRQVLGADVLVTDGRAYRLAARAEDVARFTELRERARSALAAGDPEGAVTAADEGLALWRGDAWQDLRRVREIEPDAARLEEQRVDLATLRCEALMALGRHRTLLPELEELVLRHPLREDTRGLLMLALHRCGRQADALEVYAAGRAHKVEETGLDPDAALAALHARILADDPALRVEDADLRARRHLPAPATTLVGRREEIDDVAALLRGEARLVTLTGPGGVGKTRLALRAAHELASGFPDGVWFVGLADVTDPRLVPQTIAEALGIEDSGGDLAAALREHVSSRRLLLVLDNLEQVLDAASFAGELLAAGPGVRILATSRVPLRVYGEWVRTLDPLPMEDAVPLFVERARRADHQLRVTEPEVRRVVDALDRLPLAIELVAARVGELGVAEVLDGLSSRLALASEGPRDRSPRQRTLRGAMAWSVDLLQPSTRSVFARCAAFAGGIDPEAAREVTGGEDPALAALVAASLVSRDADGRLRMLETVRDYATELLEGSGDAGAARAAHAAYFLDLAERSTDGLRGPGLPAWLARLSAERANLRAAMGHLLEHAGEDRPEGSRALRMAASLNLFLYRTTPAGEDTEWLVRALAAAPDADLVLRGRAWHGLAICRGEAGRIEEALAASRESVALLRGTGEAQWLARALNTLGGLTRDACDTATAIAVLRESADLRRRLDDPTVPLGITLENLALAALDAGDLELARTAITECAALAEDEEDEALAQRMLADIALAGGDAAGAAALLARSLPVLREPHLRYRLLEGLESAAALAAASGRPDTAASLVVAVDAALAEDGSALVPADLRARERRLGPALASLPPADLAAARATGAGWTLAQAVDGAVALAAELIR